ncbi:MAG: DNA polymerase III subunit gamma/tau [Sphaerobacter sp.]|nr:DNA polymerase III subunit gamma/tau [Sphaerobacter sp.]
MAQESSGRAELTAQSQSLYRKYRPRSFAPGEFVGQEHIARTLRNAIVLDRVAHAYLFCGPRGTGKTSTARLLAKAVNCLHPDPAERPCNACAACEAINSGTAVDIIEIDAASNRGVDDIRDLREKVKYAPTQLRVKFYIIDEAHQLTRDAFNAFLKTLEEPPGHVKFVLATTEPDKLPDTIASRCQRFDFRRFALASVVEHLRRVCEREGLEAEDEALRLIARQATGSMRDALGLLEQLALFGETIDGKHVVTAEAVRRVTGMSRSDRLVALVDALARKDAGAGLRVIAAATESGEDIHQLNRQLVAYLRTLLLIRAGGTSEDAGEETRAQAEQFSVAELAALVRTFSAIEGALNRGSYAQLPLEIALVEAIVGAPAPAADAPTPAGATVPAPPPPRPVEPTRAAVAERRVSAPRREPSPVPPASRASASPRPAPPPAGSALERLVSSWSQIRRDVKMANSRVAALLSSVDPLAVRGDEVVLVSPYEFHRNKLNDEAIRRVVEDVLVRYMGGAYRVVCLAPEEASDAAPPPAEAPTADLPADPPPANGAASIAPAPDPATDDEQRLRAARTIFGAEEIDPD